MPTNRDDFSKETKIILAKRVNNHCSKCDCATSGPNTEPHKATNIGVAAHITSAASGGPRYNPLLTSEQRKSIINAIWLCQNCAKLIDSDENAYTVEKICRWKEIAEERTRRQIEGLPLENQEQEATWSCWFCFSPIYHNQQVCRDCQAEVAYSATAPERESAARAGIFLGSVLAILFFLILPNFLRKHYHWDVPLGLGLGFYAVAITFILVIISAHFCIQFEEWKHSGKPPRFFRNTNI